MEVSNPRVGPIFIESLVNVYEVDGPSPKELKIPLPTVRSAQSGGIRKNKKNREGKAAKETTNCVDNGDVFGASIGDKSIRNMNRLILKNQHHMVAREIWDVGKMVGAETRGCKVEVIMHVENLEECDRIGWKKENKQKKMEESGERLQVYIIYGFSEIEGAMIVDQRVCITPWGTYVNEYDPWSTSPWEPKDVSSSTPSHPRPLVSSPGEALTLAQEVVITMIAKGYDLGKDALVKAKAFDESHHVSSTAAAKVVELSNRIGLTDKISTGIETVKSVDDKYQISEMAKSAASFTGRTAVAATNTVVNSSYFSKGALWVSDVLNRAAKVAADLGSHGNKN
ncbi:hypothetical protein Ancab_005649 [Ancistrocladus abbreviatus]